MGCLEGVVQFVAEIVGEIFTEWIFSSWARFMIVLAMVAIVVFVATRSCA
jgi:hypothetical protein